MSERVTLSGRLSEIEARVSAFWPDMADTVLIRSDVPWLIGRVRDLEQALRSFACVYEYPADYELDEPLAFARAVLLADAHTSAASGSAGSDTP